MDLIFDSKVPGFKVRFAVVDDCPIILELIMSLAIYENMENDVFATETLLRESLFEKRQAEVLIGEFEGDPVSFALFFRNYSTFLARANLYLEDLYVKEPYRNKGFGHELFRCLCLIALSRGCERLDWSCLNWNHSALAFYESLGATQLSTWTPLRITTDDIKRLSGM